MAEKKRDPRDTKERAIKQAVESYREINRTEMPTSERRKMEKNLEQRILPQIYEGK